MICYEKPRNSLALDGFSRPKKKVSKNQKGLSKLDDIELETQKWFSDQRTPKELSVQVNLRDHCKPLLRTLPFQEDIQRSAIEKPRSSLAFNELILQSRTILMFSTRDTTICYREPQKSLADTRPYPGLS